MNILVDTVFLVSAGVLLVAAGAKVMAAAAGRIAWPAEANFVRWTVPLSAVVALELVVVATFVAADLIIIAGFALAVSYALITVGAITMYRKECSCFGLENMTVGRAHVTMCIIATVVNLMCAFSTGALLSNPTRWILLLGIGGLCYVVLELFRLAGARKRERHRSGASSLVLVTSPTCTACRALELLEGERTRDDSRIEWYSKNDPNIPAPVRQIIVNLSFPAVISMDGNRVPLGGFETGIIACREAIETIVSHSGSVDV